MSVRRNWTPGPWVVDPHLLKIKARSGSVAETIVANPLWPASGGRPDIDERRANAELLAVAPEMVDALLELLAETNPSDGHNGLHDPDSEGFRRARTVLQKLGAV